MGGCCDCYICYRRNRSCILCLCMFLFIIACVAVAIVAIAGILMIIQVFQLIADARNGDDITRDELIGNFNRHWLIMSGSFLLLILISISYICTHLSCICNLIRMNKNIEKDKKKGNIEKGSETSPLMKKQGKLVVGKDRGVIDMDHAREEFY